MTRTKHTPGPWEACSHVVGTKKLWGVRNATMGAENPYPAHLIGAKSPLPKPQQGTVLYSWQTDNEADARLIAAAPDLLDVTRLLLTYALYGYQALPGESLTRVTEQALAAIAKVERRVGK